MATSRLRISSPSLNFFLALVICAFLIPDCYSQGTVTVPAVDPGIIASFRPPRRGAPLVFALPHYVSLTPWNSGSWEQKEGKSIWTLRVEAPGAVSLNFGFARYRLPRGASLTIRSPKDGHSLGPFSDLNNNSHRQLWTPILQGDEAEIVLEVPEGMISSVELELVAINYGFRDIWIWQRETQAFPPQQKAAGKCNVDVICPEGEPWAREARSVGLITVRGTAVCTGTLLNNTARDLAPYVLTADHCDITPYNASSVVIYWNFENSVCGGPPDGKKTQFTSGSFYRAGWWASGGSDFTLIELSQIPRSYFFPYWSGWDATPSVPTKGVAIHHPSAGEKKISINEGKIGLADLTDGLPVINPSFFFEVRGWDIGTTEPGSSGCGLWDQDHRLVGQLWGGAASCENPNGSDYFGRLWASWGGSGERGGRLKDYLDPLGSGQMAVDGVDGCILDEIDFTFFPDPVVVGEEVSFVAHETQGTAPYEYFWDMNGDGSYDCSDKECTFIYQFPYEGDVKLKIKDSNGCISHVTHSIQVLDPYVRLVFLSPKEGETIGSGRDYLIRWTAPKEAKTFNLFYSLNGGATWNVIQRGVVGNSLLWRAPVVTGNKARCLLKILAYDQEGGKVGSARTGGFFSVAVVKLVSIKGGERLRSGEVFPIVWNVYETKRPVASVKLLFKDSSSSKWVPVGVLPGNSTSYAWQVPTVKKPRKDCWLKIVLLDKNGKSLGYDTTDEPFVVEP